jgi:hypothetical protein
MLTDASLQPSASYGVFLVIFVVIMILLLMESNLLSLAREAIHSRSERLPQPRGRLEEEMVPAD